MSAKPPSPEGVPPDELIGAPLCAGPDPDTRRPRLRLPPGSCDTHAHVFGPAARYPYAPGRIYTPPDAPPAAYRRMLSVLGVQRSVLVQPSVYGTDNRAMLDAIAASAGAMRGIAVVDEAVSDAELGRLHGIGVRGIRFNVVDVAVDRGVLPMRTVRRLAERIRPLGWHVQLLVHVDDFPELEAMLAAFPTDVVIDHFGYMSTARGLADPGFQGLLRLLGSGRGWVKLTAPYRISAQAMPYPDVIPCAHALVEANPERILWGTDWPHAKHEGPMPNDGEMCERLADWIPDERRRHLALVDNPARLYGFA